jgi:hypothetical protein
VCFLLSGHRGVSEVDHISTRETKLMEEQKRKRHEAGKYVREPFKLCSDEE